MSKPPLERHTIFLDENHCNNPHLIQAVLAQGFDLERHLDHFARGVPDEEWLPVVGINRWILITTDSKIRYRALEKRALIRHRVAMFFFTTNNLSGAQMAELFTLASPAIHRLAHAQPRPFIASITKSGNVSLRE